MPVHRRRLVPAAPGRFSIPDRGDNGGVQAAAIVFDFDGLLMDTEATMLESWQQEWRHHGLELDLGTFFAPHGGDMTEQRYERLAAAVGSSYDRERSHARRIAHRDELHRRLGLREGIGAWLRQARAAGIRLAVASSSPRSWVRGHLTAVGRLDDFELIAGGDEVALPKPAPDVYLLALDRLGLDAGQAVAVEDSAHGVAAARGAGLRCIAIPGSHADLAWFGRANLVLASAAELSLAEALSRLDG